MNLSFVNIKAVNVQRTMIAEGQDNVFLIHQMLYELLRLRTSVRETSAYMFLLPKAYFFYFHVVFFSVKMFDSSYSAQVDGSGSPANFRCKMEEISKDHKYQNQRAFFFVSKNTIQHMRIQESISRIRINKYSRKY